MARVARMARMLRFMGDGQTETSPMTRRSSDVTHTSAEWGDHAPAIRRAALEHLIAADSPLPTLTVARALGYPVPTMRRALEDLAAHGVLERDRQLGRSRRDLWRPAKWARRQWRICEPEKPLTPDPRGTS
jgi:hypothetical protein